MHDDEEEQPTLPVDFRLRPSRNQKQRSKLSQVSEPTTPSTETPPTATPVSEPVANPATAPAPLKKMRLKRSGHMHEDLTAPLPEAPPKKETEY